MNKLTSRPRIGQVIGRKWSIEAPIDSGAMSSVYAARNVQTGARVAVKIMHAALVDDDAVKKRFRREGYAANAVGHPGVVQVFEEGEIDGVPFLVMELLEGETLEKLHERTRGRLRVEEVVRIGRELLAILAAAHGRGIIHRDLKPANAFVTTSGAVKILDFGIASEGGRAGDVTAAGLVMGTPAFMPPEQAVGAPIDARSDIWALGATLFTLLAGRIVHETNSPHAQLLATATRRAPLLRDVAPDVPRAIAAVIDRALAFDSADRWEDADAMRDALRLATMRTPPSSVSLESAAAPSSDAAPIETPVEKTRADSPRDVMQAATTVLTTEEIARLAAEVSAKVVPTRDATAILVSTGPPVDSLAPANTNVGRVTGRPPAPAATLGILTACGTFALTLAVLLVASRIGGHASRERSRASQLPGEPSAPAAAMDLPTTGTDGGPGAKTETPAP